jgi:GT2 family glycosyltransferase
MSEQPAVSVVTVSFNTRETTLRCLHELFTNSSGLNLEVFVVDNGSSDGSAEAIRANFPRVQVITNDGNLGFGAANNQAMSKASGEFILLLNSDAFVHPSAIATLVSYLNSHPDVGAVGPRLLNADGSLQVSCYKFPSPARAWVENLGLARLFSAHAILGDYARWAHDSERNVDFISGACMLVRRCVYEEIGGFDERFFLYAEETDWQRRMHDAGWKIAFIPTAQVTHLGGTSGARDRARVNEYFFQSLDRYELKHHGVLGLIALRCAMAAGCLVRALFWSFAVMIPRASIAVRAKLRLHWWLLYRQTCCWR